MSAVWDLDLPDSDKIVLLALADCANDEGHCWPSVASLVRKCTKSERTIQGSIKRLVDEGHLTRREVVGKGCNYTVHPFRHKIGTPEETAGRNPRGAQRTTRTPAAAADKPSGIINSEAKASSQRVIDRYNEIAKKRGLPLVRVLDASRRQQLRLRLKHSGEAALLEALDALDASPWLRGEGRETAWRPDFDFFLQPQSLRRLLEGFYGSDPKPPRRLSPEERRTEMLERALFYDRIGKPDEAADCRRKASVIAVGPVPIGEIAKEVFRAVGSA